MKAVVVPVARQFEWALDEIDISGDAALEAQFGMEIPVLFGQRPQGLQVPGHRA